MKSMIHFHNLLKTLPIRVRNFKKTTTKKHVENIKESNSLYQEEMLVYEMHTHTISHLSHDT